ncbi:hypothetical protein ACFPES_01185 [Paenibacillus sp. GCM10023248]|uniref:hypothetical protein n=1 Tax=Bacillales TaxID=1385 RepID=UPI0023799389|nr:MULTISPECIES: hypothetical protein [Bacillales]MDD9265636.1 hypothetical protein [Paenibacillus sp. MAHUQ-63]MDR6878877.1 hypothetical protein [Bacillus sp. 3255]
MKLAQKELNHLIFLTEVVLAGKKKSLMEETLQCLLYIVKSLEEVELPESVVDQIACLTAMIELDLRSENERIQEITSHLDWQKKRGRKTPDIDRL